MIWQTPWAWLGLTAAALPVLVHLLGRGRARVFPFPTLRFLAPSRLLPTRRTRLHDLPLLALRLLIVAVAVAALAQPLWRNAAQRQWRDGAMVRAIIVDTSASMRRPTDDGRDAATAARQVAERLAAEVRLATILVTATPDRVIAGAAQWLARQSGDAEIVVVSDFQVGAVDSATLAGVPATTGIRLVRVAGTADTGRRETRSRYGNGELIADIRADLAGTAVTWRAAPASLANSDAGAPGKAGDAGRAARAVGVPFALDTTTHVAIIPPESERRAELLRAAKIPTTPWMTTIVSRLRADPLLIATTSTTATTAADDSVRADLLVVARSDRGVAVILAGTAAFEGGEQLLLFPRAGSPEIVAAALFAAVERARAVAAPIDALEPSRVTDGVLASWQRSPEQRAGAPPGIAPSASDARWLWLAVLLLLLAEWALRRSPRFAAANGGTHDVA